ncbi:MAG TPA: hypothetical protein VJU86_14835 [Pyrinomonadaceae bacterium]|nr:hypothetical protein [Pyrinomonadaceae bacterium]
MNLKSEAKRASEMLKGKVVARVTRHRAEEVCLEFTDGTRIYVDRKAGGEGLELSITGTGDDNDVSGTSNVP